MGRPKKELKKIHKRKVKKAKKQLQSLSKGEISLGKITQKAKKLLKKGKKRKSTLA